MALNFILLPILTRLFEPTDYGIIDISTTIIQILGIIFGFGMTTAVSFYYYFHENNIERKITVSTALYFLLSINLIVFALLFFISTPLSTLLYKTSSNSQIIKITIIIGYCIVLQTFFSHLIRITRKASLYVLNSIIKAALQIGIILIMVTALGFGLHGYFYGYLISAILSVVIVLNFTIKHFSFKFSKARLIELLKYGAPLVPAGISLWVLQLLDRFFLVQYTSLAEVGLYGVGVRSTILLVLLTTSIQLAWGPFAFSIMKHDTAKTIYSQIFSIYVIISFWLAIITTFFSKDAITLITTPAYSSAYIVTPFLCLGTLFLGAYTLLSIGINLTKKMKLITITTVMAAISNIALNFIFIPSFGMLGAAISTAISYLISTILIYFFSQKYYPINYNLQKNLLVALIGCVYVGFYFTFSSQNTTIITLIRIAICLSFPFILYFLRLLSLSEIRLILNTIKGLVFKSKLNS